MERKNPTTFKYKSQQICFGKGLQIKLCSSTDLFESSYPLRFKATISLKNSDFRFKVEIENQPIDFQRLELCILMHSIILDLFL